MLSRTRTLDGVLLTRVLLADSKTEAARTCGRTYVDCKNKTQCHRPSLNRTVARTTLAAGTYWALYRRHPQTSGQPSTVADGIGSSRHDPYSCRAPKLNTERRYALSARSVYVPAFFHTDEHPETVTDLVCLLGDQQEQYYCPSGWDWIQNADPVRRDEQLERGPATALRHDPHPCPLS